MICFDTNILTHSTYLYFKAMRFRSFLYFFKLYIKSKIDRHIEKSIYLRDVLGESLTVSSYEFVTYYSDVSRKFILFH